MSATAYDDLTAEAAKEHLDEYVATLPRRLEWLCGQVSAGDVVLDGTPESLVPLWTWVMQQQPDLDAARDGHDLPAWLQYDEGFCARWGPRMLALADGLVAYVAEMLAAEYPGTTWVVGSAPAAVNWVHQNKPVLAIGGRKDVNLPHVITTHLSRALIRRQDRSPDGFLRAYRLWEQGAR